METDPLGTIVENPNPSSGGGSVYNTNPLGFYGTPQAPSMGCTMDRMETPCSIVMSALQRGAAMQCPDNNCGPRAVTGQDGRPVLRPLTTHPSTGELGVYGWRWVTTRVDPDGQRGTEHRNQWAETFTPLGSGGGLNFFASIAIALSGSFVPTIAPNTDVKPDDITSNQDVLEDLYCLWKRGGYGTRPTERSMWITKQGNNYGAVPWPWSAATKTESWKGPWPAGSVAIAHTHPDRLSSTQGPPASPRPSTTGGRTGKGDQGTADVTGLPVYVVTGQAIWKAVPKGKNPVQVAGNNRYKPFEKAKVKCDE